MEAISKTSLWSWFQMKKRSHDVWYQSFGNDDATCFSLPKSQGYSLKVADDFTNSFWLPLRLVLIFPDKLCVCVSVFAFEVLEDCKALRWSFTSCKWQLVILVPLVHFYDSSLKVSIWGDRATSTERACPGCGWCCRLVTQSYPTLCDTKDCSPPGSSVRGIPQARILEWVAISFSRASSQLRDWTRVSMVTALRVDSLPLHHLWGIPHLFLKHLCY